jgi:DNA repair photolyase
VIDIRTSTGTFYAAGLATHNCYARPTHEYLGYSAGLDFETRILAKEDAPDLLRAALAKPSWRPTALAMSGVTDPYQPVERELQITRRCLEVLEETHHPVTVITKSSAIERDVDILASLARSNLVHATLSITTLDRALQRAMEPRAAPPEHRLRAIRTLADAGVPVSVGVAPVIPGLTEHEIPKILEAAAGAGARSAGMILLRLPGAVEGIFLGWLKEHLPERFDRVVARLKEVRGGRLSDPRFGSRMTGEGLYAEQIRGLFQVSVRKLGLNRKSEPLSMDAFKPPTPPRGRRGRGKAVEPNPQLDLLADRGPPADA